MNLHPAIAAAAAAIALALATLALWGAILFALTGEAAAGPQRTPCHAHGTHTHCHR